MSSLDQVREILDSALSLNGRARSFDRDTVLLGDLPELDSMAVVSILTALEEQLGIMIDDEDVSAETFETLGTLADFVDSKLAEV
ncbi:acyl carrier protein [Alkalilimnicola ehrlichii]|uniref:acyl carrier protein n=1 Tax=Alkalilimnicola ehrlichii TaxID=351052 RepID=UPI003B9E0B98